LTDESEDEHWSLHVDTPGRVFVFQGVRLRAPGFSTDEDKVAYALRHVCHFLIDQIDSKGLEEVCRSLAEFYSYYRPVDEMPQLPNVESRPAVVVTRSTSPAFLISEE
jgi:hypothetical protein